MMVRRHFFRLSLLLAATLLAMEGCQGQGRQVVGGLAGEVTSGLPGARSLAQISEVRERGPYLDAMVATGRAMRRFFFPNDIGCRRVLAERTAVEYESQGPMGSVVSNAGRCDPIGIGSLVPWRDRHRQRSLRGNPSAQAVFKSFFEDEELVLVRGRFPLAGTIGWQRGDDTVAVLHRSDACMTVVDRGVATLSYHNSGPIVFKLASPQGPCEIIGFAIPR